jgi:hypothetical protein
MVFMVLWFYGFMVSIFLLVFHAVYDDCTHLIDGFVEIVVGEVVCVDRLMEFYSNETWYDAI